MPANGEVVFPSGTIVTTSMDVTIDTIVDQLLESNENFTVGIDSSTPAVTMMGSPSLLELTIEDGDGELYASLDRLYQLPYSK